MKDTTKAFLLTAEILTVIVAAIFIIAAFTPHPSITINTPQPTLTFEPATISWGTMQPGQTDKRMITLYNLAGENTAPLNMTSTCTIGMLRWDAEGKTIENEESREVTFTLTVWNTTPEGPFTFNITITG